MVVVVLIFAFALQPIVGMAGIAMAGTESDQSRSAVAPTIEGEANPEPTLEGPGAPLDPPAGEPASDLTNDPSLERGDVRPPEPEPAGTIVDAETTRRTRTTSNGDGTYVQTTSEEAINYLDDAGKWREIDLDPDVRPR